MVVATLWARSRPPLIRAVPFAAPPLPAPPAYVPFTATKVSSMAGKKE